MMSGSNKKTFSSPMGMMGGPAMASRMMQMMPMMAGNMLSELSGEERKDYIFEMVGKLVAESTSEMSDSEYSTLIDELSENLKNRNTATEENSQNCC